jgi:DNA-binding CsgD family transcriptional regulator
MLFGFFSLRLSSFVHCATHNQYVIRKEVDLWKTRLAGDSRRKLLMPETTYPVKDHVSRIVENRACPGVFMVNSTMEVLWADRRAWELCRATDPNRTAKGSGRQLPKAVQAIGETALQLLTEGYSRNPDSPLIRKIIKGTGGSLLVCGFGLPFNKDPQHSQLLILIERIGRRGTAAAQQAKEIFKLTQREVEVVQHLLKGWSNKQIAYQLKLKEQTIKEHVHRIMAKTKSESRTGILARVLLL